MSSKTEAVQVESIQINLYRTGTTKSQKGYEPSDSNYQWISEN